MGRDIDIYYLTDDRSPVTDPSSVEELCKYAASTGCTFDSVATYETITDKSTPASGFKQLQRIDWTLSSQYNVTAIDGVKKLLDAHRTGTAIYVAVMVARTKSEVNSIGSSNSVGIKGITSNSPTGEPLYDNIDLRGSTECVDVAAADDPIGKLVSGYCVIKSIKVDAQDGQTATFSIELEGSGNYDLYGNADDYNPNNASSISDSEADDTINQ